MSTGLQHDPQCLSTGLQHEPQCLRATACASVSIGLQHEPQHEPQCLQGFKTLCKLVYFCCTLYITVHTIIFLLLLTLSMYTILSTTQKSVCTIFY